MSVYKICKDGDDNCYVGSTKNFNRRKSQHKMKCCNIQNKEYNSPLPKYIRENGGWNMWNMILLETIDDVSQLKNIENKYIEDIKPSLNTRKAHRSVSHKEYMNEYNKHNRDERLQKYKEYYELNKAELSRKSKEKYKQKKLLCA